MIRSDKFLIPQRPYAVDLSSLRKIESFNSPTGDWYWYRIDAVWFRRKQGVTVACTGHLRDLQRPEPADHAQFLAQHDDGRYGGTCEGRWDGERYWGAQEPEVMAEHLELLRPMLANYPAIPAGFDGWWRF